jgi:hypothetical protein
MLLPDSTTDLQRTPATVNGEVGEISRYAPGGAPGSFRHEGQGPVRYRMLSPTHFDEARTTDAQDEHVYLIVDVLPAPVPVSKRTRLALSSLLAWKAQITPARS